MEVGPEAEIERRQTRLQAIREARERLEQRQREADLDEVVVALGREGKAHAEVDGRQYLHTAAMVARLKTERGQRAQRKRKWIAEPPNRWIKNLLG